MKPDPEMPEGKHLTVSGMEMDLYRVMISCETYVNNANRIASQGDHKT
jgi:hypothetical protein